MITNLDPQPLTETNAAAPLNRKAIQNQRSYGRWLGRFIEGDSSSTDLFAVTSLVVHSGTHVDGRTFYQLKDRVKGAALVVLDNCSLPSRINLATRCSSQSARPNKDVREGWSKQIDKIVVELGRLKPNWDGDGAISPSPALITQLERALHTLPHDTKEPEVEVDPSDGSVVVRWWSENGDTAFSMTFVGNERLYGVVSSKRENQPFAWDCSIHDETKIIDKIESPLIRKVLAVNA